MSVLMPTVSVPPFFGCWPQTTRSRPGASKGPAGAGRGGQPQEAAPVDAGPRLIGCPSVESLAHGTPPVGAGDPSPTCPVCLVSARPGSLPPDRSGPRARSRRTTSARRAARSSSHVRRTLPVEYSIQVRLTGSVVGCTRGFDGSPGITISRRIAVTSVFKTVSSRERHEGQRSEGDRLLALRHRHRDRHRTGPGRHSRRERDAGPGPLLGKRRSCPLRPATRTGDPRPGSGGGRSPAVST